MTQKERHIYMTETPIKTLIPKLALPTIISMLISAIYNMADTFFVSKISTDASAAVGIIFSIMALIQAVGFMLGMGSGTYISLLLGEKDYDTAKKTVSIAFFTSIIFGILFGGFGILFINGLVKALGSIPSVHPYAVDYAKYILIGTPFITSSFVMNNQLRSQGYALYSMIGITIGGVLNIILDPIFIFVLKMGISGAALATVLSQFVSFCILFIIILRVNGTIKITFSAFKPTVKIYMKIIHSGLPSLSRQGLASVSSIILNVIAGSFGAATIAALSIINRSMLFIYSGVIGFGQGFQPVCGFNFGAKRYDRVLEAYHYSLKVALIILISLGVGVFIFATNIMTFFRQEDAEVIRIGALALKLQCVTFPLQAYIMISQFFTQSIGYGIRSSIVAMGRQGIFLIPSYLILPRLFGVLGLQMSQPISDVFAFIVAFIITVGILKEFKANFGKLV